MPQTEAQRRAKDKYNLKAYESIAFRVPKGTRDEWRRAAEAEGKSLARFICDAVEEHLPVKK